MAAFKVFHFSFLLINIVSIAITIFMKNDLPLKQAALIILGHEEPDLNMVKIFTFFLTK